MIKDLRAKVPVPTANPNRLALAYESGDRQCRSRAALQAEILILRYQLKVLRRKSPKRLVLSNIDRLVFR